MKFTRRHYEAIAEVLADCQSPATDLYTLQVVADRLRHLFAKDNPLFDGFHFDRWIEEHIDRTAGVCK